MPKALAISGLCANSAGKSGRKTRPGLRQMGTPTNFEPNGPACVVSTTRTREEKPWPGPPRPSSKSASALRSTAICRPNSDLAFCCPPEWALTAIVLGAAAGGGFPQWNCNCDVCRLAWAGDPRVRARTQASLAVSADRRALDACSTPRPICARRSRRRPRCIRDGIARQPDRSRGADRRRDRPDRRPVESARAPAVHARSRPQRRSPPSRDNPMFGALAPMW